MDERSFFIDKAGISVAYRNSKSFSIVRKLLITGLFMWYRWPPSGFCKIDKTIRARWFDVLIKPKKLSLVA